MAAVIATGGGRPACCGGGQQLTGTSDQEAGAWPLAKALDDARTTAAQLGARFRAYAQASAEPAAFARAAAVTAAAQALGQAWVLIGGSEPASSGPGSEQAAPPGPASQTEEITQLLAGAWLLAGAVSALAEQIGRVASDATQPPPGCLSGVHACLHAARQHLAQAREQPSAEDPQHGTGRQ